MVNRFKTTKIRRLHVLVQRALLIDNDREFAEDLIDRLARAPVSPMTRSACSGLEFLLDQNKITRAKIARRFAAKKIDIFKQNLHRFMEKELTVIAQSCHLIQMTDGCTVACSWCYLNAQPYIQYAISFDSIRRFLMRFAGVLPEPIRFYWASDPLDWYDGEKSYPDLIAEFHKASGGTKNIVTTTSLPMGTEITLLRLIRWFDKNLHFKPSQSFIGEKQHYLKDNVVKGLYYQKSTPYDMNTLFDYHIKNIFYYQKTHHILKISETDVNYKRLRAIFDILKFMGISQGCLSWIEVETRDVGGSDGIKKSGRAFTWRDRDIVLDNVSMACWDSVILFPGKVGAMEMCGVTTQTQRGLEFWLVDPGKQVIPQARAVTHYEYYSDGSEKKSYLLPYAEMTEYSHGAVSNRWTHHSLTRDIQAYGLLLSKTMPLIEFVARQTHKQLDTFGPWQELKRQYKKRKATSDKILRHEKDKEKIRLLHYLTTHIEQRLRT